MHKKIQSINFDDIPVVVIENGTDAPLKLMRVYLNDNYASIHGVHPIQIGDVGGIRNTAICLVRGKRIVNNNLYQLLAFSKDLSDKYFVLFEVKSKIITDFNMNSYANDQTHMFDYLPCVLDFYGNVKIPARVAVTGLRLVGGVLAIIDDKVINIETGYVIVDGMIVSTFESDDFLFVNVLVKGVLKISKEDGSVELFKSSKI